MKQAWDHQVELDSPLRSAHKVNPKTPSLCRVSQHERPLLTYCFGGDCAPFESLAGHLPVPLPMP
jgi:hypothetical protein